VYLRGKMFEILAHVTKQPLERIEREFDRDNYMSSPEAQRFGMIDRVVVRHVDVAPTISSADVMAIAAD
jgi:ATP-dependent Clp protease protease subunit